MLQLFPAYHILEVFLLLEDGANLALQLQFVAQHSGIQNQSACTFGIRERGLFDG